MDAPWHFLDQGRRIHELDSTVFFGEALVVEAAGVKEIGVQDLGHGPLPKRLLLKTDPSGATAQGTFKTDYCGLNEQAARRVAREGVRLIGIDTFSIASYLSNQENVHRILMEKEVVIVERLTLQQIEPGIHQFIALPLPLVGADGAPCRAFIGKES